MEGWQNDRAEGQDREDREWSVSPNVARGRERERAMLFEQDRRSSSEEQEIWQDLNSF